MLNSFNIFNQQTNLIFSERYKKAKIIHRVSYMGTPSPQKITVTPIGILLRLILVNKH